jgi:hypothetical protein
MQIQQDGSHQAMALWLWDVMKTGKNVIKMLACGSCRDGGG